MSDIDQQIRRELGRLIDRAPVPVSLEALPEQEPRDRRLGVRPQVLVAGGAVVAAAALAAAALAVDGGDNQVVARRSTHDHVSRR